MAKPRPSIKIKVILHTEKQGGYSAEVPALPGCVSEGETVSDALTNIREAIEGCLSIGTKHLDLNAGDAVHEVDL
jgi:predicted RNase H-like HicB family nuclease